MARIVAAYLKLWNLSDYPGGNAFHITDIDWDTVSHILAFATWFNSDGTVNSGAGNGMTPLRMYNLIAAAHAHNKKVLYVLGGSTPPPSSTFQPALDPATRAAAVANAIAFCRTYATDGVNTLSADGLDIDWEPLESTDATKFNYLMDNLSTGLAAYGLVVTCVTGFGSGAFSLPGAEDAKLAWTSEMSYEMGSGFMTADLEVWEDNPLYAGLNDAQTRIHGGGILSSWTHSYQTPALAAGTTKAKLLMGVELGANVYHGGRCNDGSGGYRGAKQPHDDWGGEAGATLGTGQVSVPVAGKQLVGNGSCAFLTQMPAGTTFIGAGAGYSIRNVVDSVQDNNHLTMVYDNPQVTTAYAFYYTRRPLMKYENAYSRDYEQGMHPEWGQGGHTVMGFYATNGDYHYDADAKHAYYSYHEPANPQRDWYASFTDAQTLDDRIAYAIAQGLGGFIIWDISMGFDSGSTPKDGLMQRFKTYLSGGGQAGVLDHYDINSIGSHQAGQPFTLTVTAKDYLGNTCATYNGTVDLSCDSGSISPAQSGAFVNGVLTQVNVYLTKAGYRTLTVREHGGTIAKTSNSFLLQSYNLDHFALSSQSPRTEGVAFPLTITAQDLYGNTVSVGPIPPYSVNLTTNTTAISPLVATDWNNGVCTLDVTLTGSGDSVTITATNPSYGKTGTTDPFVLLPAGGEAILDHFSFATIGTRRSGQAFRVTITAIGSDEETYSDFEGTVYLTVEGANISPIESGSFAGGVLSIAVTLTGPAGTVAISAQEPGGVTGISNQFELLEASVVTGHGWQDYLDEIARWIRDDVSKLSVDDLTSALSKAVTRAFLDLPLTAKVLVAGNDTNRIALDDIPIPSAYLREDTVLSVEYPQGEVPPTFVDEDDWYVYLDPGDQRYYLILSDDVFAASESAAIEYAGEAILDEVEGQNFPDTNETFNRVTLLAAHFAMLELAAQYIQTSDTSISADVVNYGDKWNRYAKLADQLLKQYNLLTFGEGEPKNATEATAVDKHVEMLAKSGKTFLFHGRDGAL